MGGWIYHLLCFTRAPRKPAYNNGCGRFPNKGCAPLHYGLHL